MADLVPSGVAPGERAEFIDGIAGVTIPDGASCYLDIAANTIKLADADVAATALCRGISTHDALVGQPIRLQNRGRMTLTASGILPGAWYYVSTVAGGIAPFADLAAGDFPSSICKGLTTTDVEVLIVNATVAI